MSPIPILLVEDDSDLRACMASALELEGFLVTSAANGIEALQHLSRAQVLPAAILLDLRMPVMDGLEFRSALRRTPEHNGIPIVVVTAEHGTELTRQELDVTAVVKKPFSLDELVREIRRFTSRLPPPPPRTPAPAPSADALRQPRDLTRLTRASIDALVAALEGRTTASHDVAGVTVGLERRGTHVIWTLYEQAQPVEAGRGADVAGAAASGVLAALSRVLLQPR